MAKSCYVIKEPHFKRSKYFYGSNSLKRLIDLRDRPRKTCDEIRDTPGKYSYIPYFYKVIYYV